VSLKYVVLLALLTATDHVARIQLHSDLVKTTIMKDFVEFEGISKYVVSSLR
jgi:hypothetical protein